MTNVDSSNLRTVKGEDRNVEIAPPVPEPPSMSAAAASLTDFFLLIVVQ